MRTVQSPPEQSESIKQEIAIAWAAYRQAQLNGWRVTAEVTQRHIDRLLDRLPVK